MKELDRRELVANQRVANNKIYDIKEEQKSLKKEIPMYEKYFLDGNIGPDTFVAFMEKNRERHVKNRDEIKELQKKIIKIDPGIREIKDQLIKIKIHQHNESEKFEEAIAKQSDDTRIVDKILQQVKSITNQQNQILRNLSNTVETHDLKLKPSYKGSTPASGWDLHTDTDTYPILKSANEKNFHCNKFLTNLTNIKLESDKLNDIQKFWNSINTAFYSKLATNKGVGIYKELTSTYNIKHIVTPPIGHTQYAMGQAGAACLSG